MYKHTLNKRVKYNNIFNVSRMLKRNYFDETNPIPIILHPSWLGQKHIGVSLSPYLIKNEFHEFRCQK